MGNCLEVVKALVKPTEKLIDAVQGAIGKAYEPKHIRKMADAKAYEISVIGQAMRESSDIPIVYDKGTVGMDTTDFDNFVKRTQSRLAYQELTKQHNIETIIDNAYETLLIDDNVSNESIDQDWILSFFDFIANVSNEEMQILWGKLLAGEIKKPGSFSIRTLDILRKMTQREAVLFKKLLPFVFWCWGNEKKTFKDYFVFPSTVRGSFGVGFPELLILDEVGLLFVKDLVVVNLYIEPKSKDCFQNVNGVIEINNLSDSICKTSSPAYVLSESGKEIFRLMIEMHEMKYDIDFLKELFATISDEDKFDLSLDEDNVDIKVVEVQNISE